MEFSITSGSIGRGPGIFERWFPTPRNVAPLSAGIDISDASIKWMGLAPAAPGGYRVETYGSKKLTDGIVVGGVVRDVGLLADALRDIKREHVQLECAHAALPEEAAYVFSMSVPEGSPREQIIRLIEFEFEGRVPIPPSSSVFDFDVIAKHDTGTVEIGVVVFPRDIAESYVAAFDSAEIKLLSLEVEARSIARAVSSDAATEPTTLLVDFGVARTGFALLKCGVPIFTSTVDVGGDAITRAVSDRMSLSPEEVQVFKNEEGLQSVRAEAKPVVEAMSKTAGTLAEEIARHFHYWDARRNEHGERVTPVGKVILVGGSANLKGLSDFISGKVHAVTENANIWRNICSFEEYIPPIDQRTSLQYATAAGLALRSM